MGLLDRLLPRLTIGADRGELIFRLGSYEVRQEAIIRVAPDGRILEFGRDAASGDEGRLVRPFAERGDEADAALRAFCRRQMQHLSRRSLVVRPRVTLIDAALRRAFGDEAPGRLRGVLAQDHYVVELGDS